jgi:hypothetical protein
MAVLGAIRDALWMALAMGWEILWLLILGFALSASCRLWYPTAK